MRSRVETSPLVHLWVAGVIVFAPACGSDEQGSGGEAGSGGQNGSGGVGSNVPVPVPACYPGEVEPCDCAGGLVSIRECLADGTRGSCQCEPWGAGPGEFQGGDAPEPGVFVVELPVVDVKADPRSDILYATVSSPAAEHEQSLIAIAADTGEVLWATYIGDRPSILAVSDDATTAWVAVRDSPSLARVDLTTHAEVARYPIPASGLPLYAWDMDVIPGDPDRVLLLPSEYEDVDLYGEPMLLDSGIQVGQPPPFIDVDEVVLQDASTAFGLITGVPAGIMDLAVSSTGYSIAGQTDLSESFTRGFGFDGEWITVGPNYALDPATHQVVGTYPHPFRHESSQLVTDAATGRAYIVGSDETYAVGVRVYERTAFTELGAKTLEGIGGDVRRLARSFGGTLGAIVIPPVSAIEAEYKLVLVTPSALQ